MTNERSHDPGNQPARPGSGRARNTLRNVAWGFALRLVALAGPFVIRMLLIQRLGADYLGLSTFYTSLLQMLNIAELGFSTAVSFGMYDPIARGDEQAVARHANYLKRVYRIIGLAILAGGLVLMPALGVLIEGSVPADVDIALAFAIYLANTAVGYLLFAHKQTLLVAHQRKDMVDRVMMAVLVAQYAVQAVLLVAMPDFYVYALVLPAASVVANLLVARRADALLPQYARPEMVSLRIHDDERAALRSQVAGLVLQKACMLTRDPFAAVAVSAFVGLGAVAQFGNYFVVIGGVLGLLGVLGSSMTASAGNSVATESPRKNFEDLRLFVFLYAFASIVCAAVILALYQPFMAWWVGPDMVLPPAFAVGMVVYFYLRTMGDMRTVYVDATGVWWKLRMRALAETVANVVLCVVFVRAWGLAGAPLALCTSLFLFNFLYGSHLVFKLYFGLDKARAYYLDHACYALVALSVCAAAWAVAGLVPADSLGMLAVRGLVAALVSGVLCVLVFCKTKIFARACRFVRSLMDAHR